jgi:hypothetical protein
MDIDLDDVNISQNVNEINPPKIDEENNLEHIKFYFSITSG